MCCNGAQLLFPSSPSPARSAPAPRQACACGQHSHPTQGDTMTPTHKPLTALHVRPAIETSLFDFFKIGPGPSSSHTIGPMRAGHDFVQRCDALDPDLVRRAARIHVVLLGSLSATAWATAPIPPCWPVCCAPAPRPVPRACWTGWAAKPTPGTSCASTTSFCRWALPTSNTAPSPRRPLQQHPARQS